MKFLITKINKKNYKYIMIGFSLVLIGIGGFIATSNVTTFLKGYVIADSNDASSFLQTSDKTDPEYDAKLLDSKAELTLYPDRPETGDKIGELSIPKLDSTLPIYEGTNSSELDLGVGHYANSVLPGENDNSVLAGHRDTIFRNLGKVGVGDLLIVKTSAGEFKYQVNKVRIVSKDDRSVIVPKPRATLTLITCYPFDYIGSAPDRYILVAYLVTK